MISYYSFNFIILLLLNFLVISFLIILFFSKYFRIDLTFDFEISKFSEINFIL